MSKLSFLEKIFKKKDEKQINNENNNEKETLNDNIILTHNEVIYSNENVKSPKISEKPKIKTVSEQRTYRDVEGIEKKIDNLTKNRLKELSIDTSLNTKVDTIITKEKKHRKPSNVIYVVSKPQPGQVKGDWAVRSHGKIYSHHRTKENAIKTAREIARKKEATVLVQNTDGTFSEGFKPRLKTK
jgi:MFS superfamily sulfate permease-like transporter